jgi:hypothetical protein
MESPPSIIIHLIVDSQHVGTSMWRILAAFLGPDAGNTGGFLNTITNTQYVIRIATYGIQTLMGDAFIVSGLPPLITMPT